MERAWAVSIHFSEKTRNGKTSETDMQYTGIWRKARRGRRAMEMFKTLQYYWIAARGYRLKPWKSPYLRWRFETFLGPEAAELDAGKFLHLAWKYRAQMERFVDWAAERRRIQRRRA